MSARQIFVDTNILVYAHDLDAGDKHRRAKSLVRELWERDLRPAISVQVLQEFYNALIKRGTDPSKAGRTVSRYLSWDVVGNSREVFLKGMDVHQRYGVSTWDAWIIAAACAAGAASLWSEDLNPGQEYLGVKVENPLLSIE